MNYSMNVTIQNPENDSERIELNLDCNFSHDPETYGNGFYCNIRGNQGFQYYMDLRYSNKFERDRKMTFLSRWAENYWSGENGSYKLMKIEIERV